MEPKSLSTCSRNPNEGWRITIYGSAGAGKTTLLGGFPKPMLIFDFDNKLDPLYGIDGIDFISYNFDDPKDCSKVWKQFLRDFKEAKVSDKYVTLGFDSLTYMNKLLLVNVLINSGKATEFRPQIQHFGEMKDSFEFLFMEMNKIPDKNVILLAHVLDIVDDSEDSPIILERVPLITGRQIKSELPALFKEVYYLERKGGVDDKRVLYYKPYKKAIANSLLLSGDGVIESPTFDKLVARRIQ